MAAVSRMRNKPHKVTALLPRYSFRKILKLCGLMIYSPIKEGEGARTEPGRLLFSFSAVNALTDSGKPSSYWSCRNPAVP